MFDYLTEAVALYATFENFLAITLGVFVGVIIAAIPGLTVTMAVALALPFSFTMEPVTAILLLVGIYKGGMYGGSISAILINTPGSPAAACTLLDGYPLAQKGQAGKALKMALYASCVADFISNIALIFFSAWIASLAVSFGPPEFFWLMCFSFTIIITLAGDNLGMGVLSCTLGALVSLIGLDSVYGVQRFTFNSINLMDGVAFIPLLIGLFALPEIMNYYMKNEQKQNRLASYKNSTLSWSEFKQSIKSIIRGSFIGVIVGAIPGTGATAASFISYSEAKRTAKEPGRFGQGELEGVAAAEAGNNGVAGATLIPLLSLGIPGDVVTAVILGAFMIHGLTPGPGLFEDNAVLVYALFLGLLISSLILFVVGSFSIKYLSKVADVPAKYLYPVVLVFCVLGTYAINNSIFDIYLMVIFGFLGLIMVKTGTPVPPFLIGFILGPLFEDNFRRTLLIAKGDMSIFYRGPISIFFIMLSIAAIFLFFWKKRKTVVSLG